MMQRSISAILVAVTLWLPVSIMPQQPVPKPVGTDDTTLHVTAHLVPISALVLDRDGSPVTGLAKDDFVLKQDGKEQAIRYFTVADALPLTFAVLVDVSGSQQTLIEDETRASDIFFESMLKRPQDRAMLVQFDGKIQQLKNMTNDYRVLHMALEYVKFDPAGSGGTRLQDAVFGVIEHRLAAETGRKAIILISDGGDTSSRITLAETILEAQKENVAVYSICYRAQDDGMSGAPNHVIQSMTDMSDQILEQLAEKTGGRAFRVTRKMTLQKIFAQIGDGLNKQYEIGYVPPSDIVTNHFHKLELSTRDKHLKVQARKEFFAAP